MCIAVIHCSSDFAAAASKPLPALTHKPPHGAELFDIMLPEKDGILLAIAVRKLNIDVPIIFLAAKALKEDSVEGLKVGADDYITKPFSIEEFLFRIEAILKRVYREPSHADAQSVYQLAGFTFHSDSLQLLSETQTINLTRKEAKLLALFCNHQNKIIERDVIQSPVGKMKAILSGEVWMYSFRGCERYSVRNRW